MWVDQELRFDTYQARYLPFIEIELVLVGSAAIAVHLIRGRQTGASWAALVVSTSVFVWTTYVAVFMDRVRHCG